MDPNTQVGPLSSEEALIDILDQVERFEKAGAKILVGGKERLILVPLCNLPILILNVAYLLLRKNYLAQ
jgi:succinate-semialdehyde dehydrogenase/glutarate-semialdehyde dehydrogenase